MMIERDYADELGVALVDELLAAVDEIIYNQYMERQLVPYTIHSILSQALDAVDVCILYMCIFPSSFYTSFTVNCYFY